MGQPSTQPQVIGDFQIERHLGAGGMGVVYLARQISLDRRVALKVLGPSLTRAADVARFRREAQAAARLKHPGIASVYYVGQEDNICFMAMEYIDGASLRQVIGRLSETDSTEATIDSVVQTAVPEAAVQAVRFDEETEFSAASDSQPGERDEAPSAQALGIISTRDYQRRCCEVVRDAALALEHARTRGVVHRDLKPENIMLDCRGAVHIIDFGIARFFEDRTLTHTGQLVGTPMYMSPEQVTGRIELDHRSDIYSLGMILYELLTLRPPITAPTREGVLRRIATKPLPPIRGRNPAVSRELESIVHTATLRDPDQRYQTGDAFAADIQRCLDGRPVSAKPYRYAFDAREIEATRPRWLVFASCFCLLFSLLALFHTYAVIVAAVVASQGAPFWLRCCAISVPMSAGLLVVGGSLFAGFGILAARRGARFICVSVCLAFPGTVTFIIWKVYLMRALVPPEVWIFYLALLAMTYVTSGAILWGLFTRRTANWFHLARTLRSEHRTERRAKTKRSVT